MKEKQPKLNAKLRALTSAALCLPAFQAAKAAMTDETRFNITYRHSGYDEDALSREGGTSLARYRIAVDQFNIFFPLNEASTLSITALHETMSGASPWYITPDMQGEPVQVMSGASIEEARTDIEVAMRMRLDHRNLTLKPAMGYTRENDYAALSGSFEMALDFNNKLSTFSWGAGFSLDEVEPVDNDIYPSRIDREKRDSGSLFLGFAQILSRTQVLQTSVTWSRLSGYLSDPYKQSYVAGRILPDARPQARNQMAWLTRYRHYFESADASMHLDYRFYVDDWELESQTLEFAWYQNLGSWQLVPSLRYYSQSQAAFYAPYYTARRVDGFYASDYRLSPYGALSSRLQVRKAFDHFNFSISYEDYSSSGDYALRDVSMENPGLVSFTVTSVDISVNF